MDTKLRQSIRNYFAHRKEVAAVYLFGSYASGKETGSSDVDIAVLIEPGHLSPNLKDQYLVELSKITRKDIHLTIFNNAPERLAKQIYTKGHRLLVNNARQLALFNMTMYARIADFTYYADKMKAGFVRKLDVKDKEFVDLDIVIAKATAARKHLKRVREKSAVSLDAFTADNDLQDILMFNLLAAIQNIIDVAAHIISEQGLGAPGSTNEMFYLLEENGYLNAKLTEKMVKAVGFRSLIVHEYTRLDLKQVLQVAQKDITDLDKFLKAVFDKLGIG